MVNKKNKNLPYHLGIIMDGNRRWAKKNGLPSLEGHQKGYEVVKKVGRWCKERGVKVLTLWAFSTENWKRNPSEVAFLIKLLKHALSEKEVEEFHKEGIRLKVIGQKERFPKDMQELIKKAEEKTKDNKEGTLNLALSYGGRSEILDAVRKIVDEEIPSSKITEETIDKNIWMAGYPNPDLIIRTSGEMRTSGFLLWQSAYSEFYFCKKYWPEFTENDLDEAFLDYASRERRFGK